ncbi:hypothetical protein DL96DRAFT_1716212 [Flagelloscypha sp. PMI_526]|nr:hypothetical protein DL96DRAFT_1716212 [Flagelloscypha sp. PMI_526]
MQFTVLFTAVVTLFAATAQAAPAASASDSTTLCCVNLPTITIRPSARATPEA